MTFPLLTTSEGKKMGKTQSGAVWLDPEKTSPYDFYPYWRNVGDDDVMKCLRMLTFLPLEEIEAMSAWEGSQLNRAKEILAYELTALVHTKQEAEKAQETARGLFSAGGSLENMPATQLSSADLTDGTIGILDLLVTCALAPSKAEARRLIQQGGIEANGVKVNDFTVGFGVSDLSGDGLILKKGKKIYHRATL
ncbi:Tyrosine--tRNA ligase [bioreactor metagenome]|uniref:tyrosine--tRNA ligase n=1 Tax=bioreactor metagenome TaxID=1076179 RepID=A0A645BNT9_9ZZZZ